VAGCRFCGALPPGTPTRHRGSLHLAGDPPEVFVGGSRLKLSPTKAAILVLLISQGFAAHAELYALRATMTPESLKVTIYHLRELIPDDMEIISEFGKGYMLVERYATSPPVLIHSGGA
jgi:DNA-binding response OmpR family regulator